MDINDLFDGIAEAFRRYQQEIAGNEGIPQKDNPIGLTLENEPKKTEKKPPKEKKVEEDFPKRE
jgi:hypothetical protein